MTRKEKVEMLQYYCHNRNFTCLDCPLYQKYDEETDKYTEDHGCVFEDMDNEMLDKIYSWYKEIDQVSCENAEAECCNAEPDELKLHIEPKVARHCAICQAQSGIQSKES